MKEIKQRKERRFLKTLGRVGEILVEQVLLKLGSSIIKKIGGKKTLPSILFLFLSLSLIAQFPNTLNKQRLGFQTTADGLVWRGSLSDTASIQPINNQNAWVILDTVNLKMYSFDFTSNVWNLVGSAQGLTMPFDSITFNTAKNGTVGVGEVEYNDTQGSLIQGLKGGNVTNVIGQQLHQRVNNRTGAPLAKGDVVYLAGSQGNRITVAKALAVTDAFSANTFGVVAESIADNASGFIITEGLITGLNTSSLTEDSAVYLSPTVPGALTSIKPQAPQHSVYIGVCVKSNNGSGELFVKIRNGQELDELHDVQISSPLNNASLYFKSNEGLWRDTTAALLVSDTSSMLTNYLRTGVAASTYLPLTGGTLSGDLGISKSSNSILRLSSADVSSYGKLIFSSNNGGFLNYGASIESSGDGVGVDVGSLNFLTGYGTVRTNRMTITPTGNLTIVNSATIGGTLGVTGATTITGNVGIGINSSTEKLHIFNNAGINPSSTITKIETSGSTLGYAAELRLINNNTSGRTYAFTSSGPGDSFVGSSNLGIVDYTANAVRLLINSSGNIGIGTITPNAKLEVHGSAVFNEASTDSDFRVESDGNANMVFVDASTDRVGIGYASPTKTLDVNGEVRINTVTATPTSLLGKDGSNVVGEVTTVAQTGLMKSGGTTANTSSVGIITVAHGLSYTPSQVIATISQQNSYVIVCHSKDATNLSFTVYDSVTGNPLNNVSVGFFWLAIK